MKFCSHGLKALLGLGAVCGVVEGHQHHHGEEAQVPLHEQEFVQDTADELERKWSFEVGSKFSFPTLGDLEEKDSKLRACHQNLRICSHTDA